MSDARMLLEEAAHRTGWEASSMLDILCEYVDNQQGDHALSDFIATKVADELADDDGLCSGCKVPVHDVCPLESDDCRCCNDTRRQQLGG